MKILSPSLLLAESRQLNTCNEEKNVSSLTNTCVPHWPVLHLSQQQTLEEYRRGIHPFSWLYTPLLGWPHASHKYLWLLSGSLTAPSLSTRPSWMSEQGMWICGVGKETDAWGTSSRISPRLHQSFPIALDLEVIFHETTPAGKSRSVSYLSWSTITSASLFWSAKSGKLSTSGNFMETFQGIVC